MWIAVFCVILPEEWESRRTDFVVTRLAWRSISCKNTPRWRIQRQRHDALVVALSVLLAPWWGLAFPTHCVGNVLHSGSGPLVGRPRLSFLSKRFAMPARHDVGLAWLSAPFVSRQCTRHATRGSSGLHSRLRTAGFSVRDSFCVHLTTGMSLSDAHKWRLFLVD